MKRLYLIFLLLMSLCPPGASGQVLTIAGTGTLNTSTYAPISSNLSAYRIVYHYPQAQITAGGMPYGAAISSIAFERGTGSASALIGPNFKIYMENRPASSLDLGNNDLDWALTIPAATLVYDDDPTTIVGTTAGYKTFPFGTGAGTASSFVYTGGAVVVYIEYTQTASPPQVITWRRQSATTGTPSPTGWTSNSTMYGSGANGNLPSVLFLSSDSHPHTEFTYATTNCVSPIQSGVAASAYPEACAGSPVNLTLTGSTAGGGISIQWQYSPAGMNNWANAPGGTLNSFSTTQAIDMDYRAIVTCSNGGSATSNTVTVNMNPVYLCYCSPFTGVQLHTNTENLITNVSIPGTTLDNTTTATGPGGYTRTDFNIPSCTGTLQQLESYSLKVALGPSNFYRYVASWIDYNQNGVFDTAEYKLLTTAFDTARATLYVPVTAVPGYTGMRVRVYTATSYNPGSACISTAYCYETEDYTIEIAPAPACNGIPAVTGTISATAANICNSGITTLSINGFPAETGISLQWESSPIGQNNWLAIPGATDTTYTSGILTAGTDFRVAVTCGNPGGGTAYTAPFTVNVGPVIITSTTDGARCGPGTVALDASASAGSIVKWYSAPAGGSPLGTGNSFTTPFIYDTTLYYVAANSGSGTTQSSGTGSPFTNAAGDYGLVLNINQNLILNSVEVFATNAGNVTIELQDNTGAVIAGPAVNPVVASSGTTPQTLPLSFYIPAGTGYRLIVTGVPVNGLGIFGQTLPVSLGNGVGMITNGWNMANNIANNNYYYLYNLNTTTGCESARTPVNAFVNSSPPATAATTPDTICNGASAILTATSSNAGYSYSWLPGNISGNTISVSPVVATKYYLSALDNATGCTYLDTVLVSVRNIPANSKAVVNPKTVCFSGAVTMGLNQAPGYILQYQWQVNNGNAFVDIPGANNATYSTTVSATTIYRMKFLCGGNVLGHSLPDTVTRLNPSATIIPGSRCGAGRVALRAIPTAGAIIKWYASATGGSALGTGNIFTTPSLTNTTNYYAAPVILGGGTSVYAGPTAPSTVGSGGGTASNIGYYHMAFNVLVATTLVSVDVFPTGPIGSNGTIVIRDNTNTTLATIPFTTTVTGGATAQTIPINLPLAVGNNYQMGQGTAVALFRNYNGAVYPYSNAQISVTGNNFDPIYYYYFYNWRTGPDCESPRIPVAATISPAASGTGLSAGGTVAIATQNDGTTVTYQDACNDKVAAITDAVGGNVLGSTTATVLTTPAVQSIQGIPFVSRVYDIAPTSNGPATVTLYIRQAEFTAYNTYVQNNNLALPLLPAAPNDVAGMSHIVITQYHGSPLGGTTGPFGLYNAGNKELIQNSSITVAWNGTYWVMAFPVTGFSGFYIHSGDSPLLIDLKSIDAVNIGNSNRVDWVTASEMEGDRFELERSADGAEFTRIMDMNAREQGSSYRYFDREPLAGINYYRLKMLNANGAAAYSKTVTAVTSGRFAVTAYPNPVKGVLTVRIFGYSGTRGWIDITDIAGRIVKTMPVTGGAADVDMSRMAAGIYIMKYTDSEHSEIIKITKE